MNLHDAIQQHRNTIAAAAAKKKNITRVNPWQEIEIEQQWLRKEYSSWT